MILNKELEKHYLPYTESEKLFKTFYELAKGNKPTDSFLDSIDNIDIRSFMQNVVDTGNYHFSKKCDLFFIYKEDITVSKHIRYYPYFMHKHYFYEIIYQLTGTSRHIINNMDISMEEGNLLIIPPSSFHAAGVLDDSIIVNIIVKPNSLDVLLSDLLPENNIFETFFSQTRIFHSDINYIYIPSTEDKKLQELVEEIVLEDINKKDLSTSQKKILVMHVLCHLLRHYVDTMKVSKNSNRYPTEVKSICQYLHVNYRNASLTDVAKEFGYSPTYLSKLIHSSTGKTFSEIVCGEKLMAACKLLATTSMKISDIAEHVGYSSPEYFNKVFKMNMGVSPSQYRKEYDTYPAKLYKHHYHIHNEV